MMEIITKPYNLENDSILFTNCVCCNSVLEKEVKRNMDYLIRECYECSYDDRPFGWCRADKGPCTCEYGKKDFLYITCEKCLTPKCIECGEIYGKYPDICKGEDCNKFICQTCLSPPCIKCGVKYGFSNGVNKEGDKCYDCKKYEKFKQKWEGTIRDKLELHGVIKLKILAKKKNLKGYSKLLKDDLIDELLPLTTNDDFPIR